MSDSEKGDEMKTSSQIRNDFVNMLKKDGHNVIPSAPLIPPKELGLLFTNAGMNQFSKYFSGEELPPDTRLGSVQKCIRVSGKHNDFEAVGFSPHHHTFFEMLGYFSFGDYFKEHAINLGWKYYTEILGIPADRLFITVYKDDDESMQIWKDTIGIGDDRLFKLDKTNFWEMGETGPCGPSTEIIYDLKGKSTPTAEDLEDSIKYLELGNIVFTQYYKDNAGNLEPLPKKNVDTGLGFERIVRVVQGADNNFESDLFLPLIREIEMISGLRYAQEEGKKPFFRVAADHIRALTFLIGDGVLPSNAGRGYVVRKLLRRAASNLRKLSIEEPFLYKLVRTVKASMGDFYPEISEKTQLIENIILEEEERFIRLVKTGFTKYVQLKEKASNNNDTLGGEELFELYDTYGFPIDLVKEMARDDGLKLDVKGFNEKMSVQREMARSSHKKQDLSALRNIPESVFTGYDALTGKGNILAILDLKYNPVDALKNGEKGILLFENTPFYGESGGQAGDSGNFSSQKAKGKIYDTQIFNDRHLHMIKVEDGELRVKDEIRFTVDQGKRDQIRIHHTLSHLLHSVLRDVLGEHCHQAGSFVGESGLRFDFTHFKKVTDEELTLIEKKVNQSIGKANEVQITETTHEQALEMGAMALFESKYKDKVRLVHVEGVSLELCGGLHVENTLQARGFKIISENSVAAGIRRIKAVGGEKYIDMVNTAWVALDVIKQQTKSANPLEEIRRLQESLSETEKRALSLEKALLQKAVEYSLSEEKLQIIKIDAKLHFAPAREVIDDLRNRFPEKVFLFYQVKNEKLTLALGRGSGLELDLVAFMKQYFKAIGGGGGGRPEFIQCGGGDPQGIQAVIEGLKDIVK